MCQNILQPALRSRFFWFVAAQRGGDPGKSMADRLCRICGLGTAGVWSAGQTHVLDTEPSRDPEETFDIPQSGQPHALFAQSPYQGCAAGWLIKFGVPPGP